MTEDGSKFYVDDVPFARRWLAESGWLSVFSVPEGDAVTIRTDPDDVRDGVRARIVSVEPVSFEAAWRLFGGGDDDR